MPDESMWRPNAIRVFMSHISEHKAQVGELASLLEDYGFSAFVAHDAIAPTEDWQNVIRDALSTCHVLVAFLTPGFHESVWTDQEVGWAMGRGALIVPVNVGAGPYGFLARYQAAASPPSATLLTRAIATAVFRSQSQAAAHLTGLMVDVIVQAFSLDASFNHTRACFALVQMVPHTFWNESHFDRMTKAAQENRQLRDCNLDNGMPLPEALQTLIGQIRSEPKTSRPAPLAATVSESSPEVHIRVHAAVSQTGNAAGESWRRWLHLQADNWSNTPAKDARIRIRVRPQNSEHDWDWTNARQVVDLEQGVPIAIPVVLGDVAEPPTGLLPLHEHYPIGKWFLTPQGHAGQLLEIKPGRHFLDVTVTWQEGTETDWFMLDLPEKGSRREAELIHTVGKANY